MYEASSKFNYDKLNSQLQRLPSLGYSQILSLVIANLCEVDSDKRSSCSELYNWLNPFEERIVNLESFEIANLPPKIAQQVQPQPQAVPIQGSNPVGLGHNVVYQQQQVGVQGQIATQSVGNATFSPYNAQPYIPTTYVQQPSYYSSVSHVNSGNVGGSSDEKIKNMALALEKIDEQLKLSRKMFPS